MKSAKQTKIYSAKFVLPISSKPIEKGSIFIEDDKIIAVGETSEILKVFPSVENKDFGEVVLMPCFINTHSHLELTSLRGYLDHLENDFTAWLITLSKVRGEILTQADIKTFALLGVTEGIRAGVSFFADIGRFAQAGFEALKQAKIRGISYQETEFSPKNETAKEDFQKLKEKFLSLRENETNLVKTGISPHAPYTVSSKLFEEITNFALSENVKLTIHAAESLDEQNFLLNGNGTFAKMYEKFGLTWQTPKVSTIQYFKRLGVLQTKPLLAHCVYANDEDIETIFETETSIVHCPKSNAKFGHGIAPLEKFIDKKLKFGFGSDSVVSNNSCDILEEARFATLLARTREDKKRLITAEEVLYSATLGGAKAVGLDSQIGSLEIGKQADFIAVSLKNLAQQPVHDIYATLLFATTSREIESMYIDGEEIFADGKCLTLDETELFCKSKEIVEKLRNV
jgi:5-methylthioadenosine/S-adenosylhomocysteine deaminase